MKGNNVKALNSENVNILKAKYEITTKDDLLFIKSRSHVRAHDRNKKFSLIIDKRKTFKIFPKAVKIWIDMNCNECLIDIQNAMNKLHILHQDINIDSVKSILINPNV